MAKEKTEIKKKQRIPRNQELDLGDTTPKTKKSIIVKVKEWLYPADLLLINMQMRNGFYRSLTIIAKRQEFKFNKGTYIVDSEKKFYNTDLKIWCLDYHQDIALPLNRDVNANEIKKKLQEDIDVEVEHSIDPLTLNTFLTAKIAEGVMKGQAIDDFLRSMKMMLFVTMVAAIIHLMLFVFKTGMLDSVGI